MARIFFEFSAGIGPMIRCLPIALELQKLGHEIEYFSHEVCRGYMEQYNFKHIDIAVSVCNDHSLKLKHDWIDADEYWSTFGFSNYEWFSQELNLWVTKLNEFQPDIIISDLGVFAAIAARILSIPLITITQSCYHPRSKHLVQGYWMPNQQRFNKTLTTINKVLREHNVSILSTFEDVFLGDITLIPGFPEFDQLVDNERIKDKTYYIGPILWEGIIQKNEIQYPFKDKSKPRVFCYAGQFQDYSGNFGLDLFEKLINVFNIIDFNIVITTGNSNIMDSLKYKYKNVVLMEWLPSRMAYENSDLVINHGGHGSCMGLFKYGVPGLILPTHTEREYNARLVDELGTGLFINSNEFDEDIIKQSIYKILFNRCYFDTVKQYSQQININYSNGVESAIHYILSLL
jgi:Glycosyl transferases, related to UDP-glucuronosyltransferase